MPGLIEPFSRATMAASAGDSDPTPVPRVSVALTSVQHFANFFQLRRKTWSERIPKQSRIH